MVPYRETPRDGAAPAREQVVAMLKSEIVLRGEYAYRAKMGLGLPFQRVRALHLSTQSKGKIRVQFLEGTSTDDEAWVSLGQLHGPWEAAAERLMSEQRLAAVIEESDEAWDPSIDEPLLDAIELVLRATGESTEELTLGWGKDRGLLRIPTELLRRICFRARIAADVNEFGECAYVEDDTVVMPFGGALRLAKQFAVVESVAVLAQVAKEERRGREYPTLYDVDAQTRAAMAIAQSWANDGQLPSEIAARQSNRVHADYAEVLHRVAALGTEHRKLQLEARELFERCADELRKRNAKRLAQEVDWFVKRLKRADGDSRE